MNFIDPRTFSVYLKINKINEGHLHSESFCCGVPEGLRAYTRFVKKKTEKKVKK